jgi:hypothetical protein
MTPGLERFSDLEPLNNRGLAEIKRHALLTLQFLDGERIAARFDRYKPSRPGTHCVRFQKRLGRGAQREIFCVVGNRNCVSSIVVPRNVVTVSTEGRVRNNIHQLRIISE